MRFIAIPGSVLSRTDLSATDKLLYGLLRFHQHGQGECWPSQTYLAEALGCSVRAIGKSLKRLEAAGLVVIHRRFKQSNAYEVQLVSDPTYLRVWSDILSLPDVPALHKLVMAALEFKAANEDGQAWPHHATLATELGCSRSTVIRTLQDLEAEGRVQVKHRGGGRQRGNIYRLERAFYSVLLEHGRAETVSKVPNRKTNNSADSKETGPQRLSRGGLSACRPIESPPTPAEQAEARLVRHGVNRAVAAALVYEQHHPPDSIEQAIDNALLRRAQHRQADPHGLKSFKLAGYIVGTLNRARQEIQVVKPSRLFRQARAHAEQDRTAWTPLPADEFEQRRRRCLGQLQRTA